MAEASARPRPLIDRGYLTFGDMARATDIKPYSIEFESFVTDHHVYKAVWSPFIGKSLNTQMELDNVHDKYDVKVLKN